MFWYAPWFWCNDTFLMQQENNKEMQKITFCHSFPETYTALAVFHHSLASDTIPYWKTIIEVIAAFLLWFHFSVCQINNTCYTPRS